PRGLDIIVSGCLRKDPSRRFQHLSDVRIILEKLRDDADSGSASASQLTAAVLPPRRPRWKPVAAALAFTLAGASLATAVLLWKSPPEATGTPAQRIIRLTWDGSSREPAISPDGRLVAYISWRHNAKQGDLWVQQVNGGSAIRLTDDPAPNHRPVFSADGSKIWFFSGRQPPGVYEVPSLGGEARLLLSDSTSVRPSPDGKWLAYIAAAAGSVSSSGFAPPGKLMLRPVEGGAARELAPSHSFAEAWLGWSADSRELLAGSGPGMSFSGPGLYQIPIDRGTPRRRTEGALEALRRAGLGNLNLSRLVAWFPDDTIAFAARFGDSTNVFRVPLPRAHEAPPAALTAGPLNNSDAFIQGNRLVYAHKDIHQEIWSLPADLNSGKVLGELHRVTAADVEAQFPDVHPNGSTVVYHSRKFGIQGVFQLDLKTGKERTVSSGDSDFAYATLSPDGTKVAIGQGGKGWPAYLVSTAGGDVKPIGSAYGRLGLLELATGKASEIAASETLELHSPRLSPDGNWVLFGTWGGQSTSDMWLAPCRGNQPIPQAEWELMTEGSGLALWSPDGRSVYFVKSAEPNPMGAGIYRQPVDPATGRLLGPATEFHRLDGYTLGANITNSICANRDQVLLTVMQGRSDIWMTTF
ncbi:MAG: hypothetical protein NTY38_22750, partial [Acidobacteria bacterium]|nr:hypothetical protein [Acidobacteriota bacterium]